MKLNIMIFAALNPSLTTADEIHKAVNWWIFNSFGGPTLDQSDIDPATGAPTVYKGETLLMLFVQVKS